MTDLRTRLKNKRDNLVVEPLSCIPKLIDEDRPDLYAIRVFQSELRSNPSLNKVIVIDPYLDTADLQFIAGLFGGASNVSVEVISKFNSIDREDDKETRKLKLMELSRDLESNGIFKRVEIRHSFSPMHDRYFVFCVNENVAKIVSIGGSLSQRFSDYISMQKVTEPYMIRSIERYIEILIKGINNG